MLTDKERAQPVTVQNLADALGWVLVEVFAAIGPQQGGSALEQAAHRLLETGGKIRTEPGRSIILALSENLIAASETRR